MHHILLHNDLSSIGERCSQRVKHHDHHLEILFAVHLDIFIILVATLSPFRRSGALRGTRALFATPEGPVEGEVVSIEPMRGLVVRTDSGERFLPALTTSVAEWGVFRRVSPESPLKTADSERR